MESFLQSIYNLVIKWQPLAAILAAICILGAGVMIMIPSDEVRTKGRKALPWIVLGVGIVLGATILGKEIAGAFAF